MGGGGGVEIVSRLSLNPSPLLRFDPSNGFPPWSPNPKMNSHSETRRCQYHCSGCDSCFVSLRAFDAHRFGPWENRTCWDESVEGRVVVARNDGLCEIGFPQPTIGRTLYRTCTSRETTAIEPEDGLDPDLAA